MVMGVGNVMNLMLSIFAIAGLFWLALLVITSNLKGMVVNAISAIETVRRWRNGDDDWDA